MDGGLLVARIILAGVFGVAALAKLADREGSRFALAEFGVPERLTRGVALLLPLAELATAVLLLLTPTARIGALAALVLLGVFIVAIAVNLARGRQPDCHCFGQLHSAPAGPWTLVRNGVLAVAAALILWKGPGAGAPDLSPLAWAVLAGAVIAALVLTAVLRLILQLMQQNGRLLSAFDLLESRLQTIEERLGIDAPLLQEGVVPGGLAVGARAPAFSLTSLDGDPSSLEALRAAGKPVLLIFSDPGCGPCTALLPDVSRWQQVHVEHATIALISRGSEEANLAKSQEFGVTNVLLQQNREVAEAYRTAGTPSGVIVRPDGSVGSHVAAGADGIRALVRSLARPAPETNGKTPSGVAMGSPAPNATLTDLEGDQFELVDYRGERIALLFWNPGCGFCKQMLDDVKSWEQQAPKDAPRLIVVSTGPADTNREQGFRSVLGLDEGFSVGRVYAAAGTPSAVLIDEDGNVASHVAVGADQVLELLKTKGPGRRTGRTLETSS